MLVYVNNVLFEPEDGFAQLIHHIAQWVARKTRHSIDDERLARGIRELKFKDGSFLSSKSTRLNTDDSDFPFIFSFQYTHGDQKVSGRRWITEIGLRQNSSHHPVECSILLRTEEISTKVTTQIPASRPRIIVDLVEYCRPIQETPGLFIKELTLESAQDFQKTIESNRRRHAIVVLSADEHGAYMTDPEKLRALLLGLADVYIIPEDVSTYSLEKIIDRKNFSFKGAIRVIYPRRNDNGSTSESQLMQNDGSDPAFKILESITHRTNVPMSWRHISEQTVSELMLKTKITRMLRALHDSAIPLETQEYIDLLEETEKDLTLKDSEIIELRAELEDLSLTHMQISSELEGAKYALSFKGLVPQQAQNDDIDQLRSLFASMIDGETKVETALRSVGILYRDRIEVLDSAYSSARIADKAKFEHVDRVVEMLNKLARDYWNVLAQGGSDQQAKEAFGKYGYAANDKMVSTEGRNARTFTYKGRKILMERHLRYGLKESPAHTIRIHFEWLADERKIVIGHCGQHLPR